MNQEQRKLFAKGLVDLANLVAAAMVFGQFVSDSPVDFSTAAVGVIIALVFYCGGYWFSRGGYSFIK